MKSSWFVTLFLRRCFGCCGNYVILCAFREYRGWDEEGLCSSGQDAKELATDVKAGGPGKGGAIYSDGIWIHQGWFNQLLGIQRT